MGEAERSAEPAARWVMALPGNANDFRAPETAAHSMRRVAHAMNTQLRPALERMTEAGKMFGTLLGETRTWPVGSRRPKHRPYLRYGRVGGK